MRAEADAANKTETFPINKVDKKDPEVGATTGLGQNPHIHKGVGGLLTGQ